MKRAALMTMCLALVTLGIVTASFSAYHHEGEKDSPNFLLAYPDKAGTKLDQCALCHSGGSYVQSGKTVTLGSCQWCHYTYGYDGHGNIMDTLNTYGKDYLYQGRNEAALHAIESLDSDSDTYSNIQEIQANRYPGDPTDDPNKVIAPYRVYSKAQLEAMPQHTQFLLMNASRQIDNYAEYSGVTLGGLLLNAGMHPSATGITVYSPDGWSQYHPLYEDPEPEFYHVFGTYPQSVYYYNAQADRALNATDGWCEYNAPSCAGRNHLDPIYVTDGLQLLFASKREGAALQPGVLNADNKLDGEGPFRVVPPQRGPCPPDQSARAANQNVLWPYDAEADHNAGAATRTVTIIKVAPLPPGTTDIDLLEAGWKYVDEEKLIVYGAIEPGKNELAVDFADYGLWHYRGSWEWITPWNPRIMSAWFGGIAAGFGEGSGLWSYDGSVWSQITGWDPELMIPWYQGLAVDFGADFGLWNYTGGKWNWLAESQDTLAMAGWAGGLAAAFVETTGIWNYDGTSWNLLSDWRTPELFGGWCEGLAVAFGNGTGIYSWDGTQWIWLTGWRDPSVLTGWTGGLAAGFGLGTGLWNYEGGQWVQIAGWDPVHVTSWDNGLVADFGDGRGLWNYDGTAWIPLAGWPSQGMMGVNIQPD